MIRNHYSAIETTGNVNPATASKHVKGFGAVLSESSDTFQTNRFAAEMFATRSNMKLTCFEQDAVAGMDESFELGVMDFAIYDQRSPAIVNPLLFPIRNGNPATALSYQGGSDDNKLDYLDDVLVGRNSQYEPAGGVFDYEIGQTDEYMISLPSTFRYNYYSEMTQGNFIAGSNSEGLVKLNDYLDELITKGGWFTNFMHWHWWVGNYAPNYFNILKDFISTNDVYCGSWNEIGEYYFVKSSVSEITYNNANGTITIDYSQVYPNSPYENIITPLWIKFNTGVTQFNNLDISCEDASGKIRKKATNEFYIPVLLDYAQSQKVITITSTETPDYLDLTPASVSIVGNDVTSDKAIKYHLYRNVKGANEINTGIVERNTSAFSTSYTIAETLDTATYDYYFGWITEDGVSGVELIS